MIEEKGGRILYFAPSVYISIAAEAPGEAAAESPSLERPELSPVFAWEMIALVLAVAFVAALFALYRLDHTRRRNAAATHRLAELAQRLKAGEPPEWTATAAPDVDNIAYTLCEFGQRLRRKRALLTRLNEELIRQGVGGEAGVSNYLRAIIDALPVGVLIAEAPSGRILVGNAALETIRRGPVIYSEGLGKLSHWVAVHESGEPVQEREYPLARALAGEDRPTLECRHQRADGTWGWISIVGAPIRDATGEIIAAIVAVTDIDELKSADEHRRLMNLELHHRVNNSLAMIQGVANITARTATDFTSFRNSFSDRIQCLSRLSTLLVQKSWARTPMKELTTTALACDSLALRDRISMSGEDVELRSEVALALGMAMHELLSNAERHGALSAEQGHVNIEWRIADDEGKRLRVDWTEQGGPPITPPQRTGVGQYLMKTVLARQFGGDIEIAFEPDGVRATITAEV
ncbi:MAG: HWE histidine kinase domain-containing protein [Methylocystis sp.]